MPTSDRARDSGDTGDPLGPTSPARAAGMLGHEPVARPEALPGVVGIVGAGPVGLACALRLSTFGIRSVVLEAEPALRKRGSKACCIQGDVVEILDKVGCAEAVVAEGIPWHVARTYVGGRELRTTVYPQPDGFPPFVNISQYRTEQILLERLERTGGLSEVLWSHQVTGLERRERSVVVEATTPEGTRVLELPYLVACDGIHSAVRRLSGVEWTGYSHGDRFLITDIRARLPIAPERHFHYDPPFNPGRQLIMHAQPDDVWRIDWQLPPDVDIDAERANGQLDTRIRAVIGTVPYEIDWLSTYRFHQRVVARMRLGPLFFAGDAAHALPPYGARGMNSGIQDVDNLAWKLDLVVRGLAADDLLETYHTERHAAARENLRITESTIRFMVPPSPLRRWGRNAVLRLASSCKPLARFVNSGRMAEPFAYTDSPIVDRRGGSPLAGRFAPDAMVSVPSHPVPSQESRQTRLRHLVGEELVVLYLAAGPVDAQRFVEQATASGRSLPHRLVVCLPGRGALRGAAPGPHDHGGPVAAIGPASVVYDTNGDVRRRYGAAVPCWYVIRPDGHIAAVGEARRASTLGDALRRATRAAMPAGEAGGAHGTPEHAPQAGTSVQ